MVGSPFTARARVKEPSRPYSPKPSIFLLALSSFPRCRRACLYPQLCVYLIIPAGIRGGSLTRPLFTNDPQRLTLYEVFDVLVKVRVSRQGADGQAPGVIASHSAHIVLLRPPLVARTWRAPASTRTAVACGPWRWTGAGGKRC